MNQKKETIVQAMGEEARHLRNIRQLTFGGENAEAYFSFDDRKLIFQSKKRRVHIEILMKLKNTKFLHFRM